jgi:2,4-dienoyl-CoA reductase-like NADH-dependent reductase (Old Yellow Enzyme family)
MRAGVDVPVIAVGRILPESEEMLVAGECDSVAMGRQLLADPDLVVKPAKVDRPRSVRASTATSVREQNLRRTPRVR